MLQPKEQHSASCPAAFGWHRLEVPPHAKGCLDMSELSATGRTNLTGRRYMTMCSREGEEVQREKKARGCETRKYLKFLCSTGASQGFLRGSGMGYRHRTLVSAANPLQAIAVSCKTSRCYQTWHHDRAQFQGENGWQKKSPYKMVARSGTKQKVAEEMTTNVTEKEENDPKHLQTPMPCLGWVTR